MSSALPCFFLHTASVGSPELLSLNGENVFFTPYFIFLILLIDSFSPFVLVSLTSSSQRSVITIFRDTNVGAQHGTCTCSRFKSKSTPLFFLTSILRAALGMPRSPPLKTWVPNVKSRWELKRCGYFENREFGEKGGGGRDNGNHGGRAQTRTFPPPHKSEAALKRAFKYIKTKHTCLL